MCALEKVIWIRKTASTMNRDEGTTDYVTHWTVCSPRHLASSGNSVSELKKAADGG